MEDDDDDPVAGVVTACAGPPACLLEGDVAIEAQKAGCIWCRRIYVMKDGTEIVTEPGHA